MMIHCPVLAALLKSSDKSNKFKVKSLMVTKILITVLNYIDSIQRDEGARNKAEMI